MVFDWRCESCGTTGVAIRLAGDKKTALQRVRLSHFYARRKRKFCNAARLFWTIRPSGRGAWA